MTDEPDLPQHVEALIAELAKTDDLTAARQRARSSTTPEIQGNPQTISKAFVSEARKAGLPRIRLHDLRHSWATMALGSGVPAKVVSERLGHASIGITLDTYSHVMPQMDQAAADTVAASIFGG